MKNLHRIVTEFRRGLLGKTKPNRMCIVVCFPLQGFLNTIGYETALVTGELRAGDLCTAEHVWLQLPDGKIIDPTADQFSTTERPMPEVYIGKKPKWYLLSSSEPEKVNT